MESLLDPEKLQIKSNLLSIINAILEQPASYTYAIEEDAFGVIRAASDLPLNVDIDKISKNISLAQFIEVEQADISSLRILQTGNLYKDSRALSEDQVNNYEESMLGAIDYLVGRLSNITGLSMGEDGIIFNSEFEQLPYTYEYIDTILDSFTYLNANEKPKVLENILLYIDKRNQINSRSSNLDKAIRIVQKLKSLGDTYSISIIDDYVNERLVLTENLLAKNPDDLSAEDRTDINKGVYLSLIYQPNSYLVSLLDSNLFDTDRSIKDGTLNQIVAFIKNLSAEDVVTQGYVINLFFEAIKSYNITNLPSRHQLTINILEMLEIIGGSDELKSLNLDTDHARKLIEEMFISNLEVSPHKAMVIDRFTTRMIGVIDEPQDSELWSKLFENLYGQGQLETNMAKYSQEVLKYYTNVNRNMVDYTNSLEYLNIVEELAFYTKDVDFMKRMIEFRISIGDISTHLSKSIDRLLAISHSENDEWVKSTIENLDYNLNRSYRAGIYSSLTIGDKGKAVYLLEDIILKLERAMDYGDPDAVIEFKNVFTTCLQTINSPQFINYIDSFQSVVLRYSDIIRDSIMRENNVLGPIERYEKSLSCDCRSSVEIVNYYKQIINPLTKRLN